VTCTGSKVEDSVKEDRCGFLGDTPKAPAIEHESSYVLDVVICILAPVKYQSNLSMKCAQQRMERSIQGEEDALNVVGALGVRHRILVEGVEMWRQTRLAQNGAPTARSERFIMVTYKRVNPYMLVALRQWLMGAGPRRAVKISKLSNLTPTNHIKTT